MNLDRCAVCSGQLCQILKVFSEKRFQDSVYIGFIAFELLQTHLFYLTSTLAIIIIEIAQIRCKQTY